ncbi:MAG: cation transporter [Streptosporangiaceae bacterium]
MSLRGADRGRLWRRAVVLEYTSMTWTLAIATAALAAGVIASSIALIGLGLDSAIELVAAGVVVWHLRGAASDREAQAAGLIAITFLAGAAFLLGESVHELTAGTHSGHSAAGIGVSSAAVVALPALALAKLRAGQALGNRPLIADAGETLLTAAAAAAALLGVGLDTWIGWWWAIPAAGIAIAVLAITEAIETWHHRRSPVARPGAGAGPGGSSGLSLSVSIGPRVRARPTWCQGPGRTRLRCGYWR